ncbi:MAG: phosphotransferase family protein [Pseudomonadales bacterium]
MAADQALSRWLAEHAGLDDVYVASELGGGNSNVTLLLEARQGRYVLRRPPANSISPLASRGVKREHDVLKALDGSVPAPRALAFCDDPAVIGAPFALFSFLPGTAITETLPADYPETATTLEQIGCELADGLACLHRVDSDTPGLPRPTKSGDFLRRQIERWMGIRRSDQVRELIRLEPLAEALLKRLPGHSATALVHGDYHLDNTLFLSDRPVLSGIIDWELAGLGDPLCDLGLLLAFWGPRRVEPAGFDFVQAVSRSRPCAERDALAERWARRSGHEVIDLPFYCAFALWRLAAMVEGAYSLYRQGRVDSPYARHLEFDVPRLLEEAAAELGVAG